MIEMRGITKHFGAVTANENVNLTVRKGEILSILGENGSGKTSLMNMLAGIYYPDAGHIYVDGKEVVIRSPKDASNLGIGMIHQHFKLVDVLTAAENIILGLPGKLKLDLKQVERDIYALIQKYGFEIDLDRKIYEMSVSQKQTVEIVKMLYRGANILILDEPTAVLTPQETDKLFSVLRNMRDGGHAIIIITHKLNEVLSLSDRVSVLRKGHSIGSVDTKDATELSLTEMMVGKKINLDIDRPMPIEPKLRLHVKNASCLNKEGREVLAGASFEVFSGEILGIAGIAGSGQKELLEAIAGLRPMANGEIAFIDEFGMERELHKMSAGDIRALGVRLAFVPEDRLGMGLVASMGMTGNMMLRTHKQDRSFFSKRKLPRTLAQRIVEELEVVTPGIEWPVGRMSGGNVQKVLVGREIASAPQILMVAYPVRGLDINSSYTIYRLLNEQKQRGVAVICVGEDLDVLLALCDRILVLSGGKVSGITDGRTVTKEELGLLMTQSVSEPKSEGGTAK
ncbi:MAG: ABC transporter ATP-binding protein [Clostridia bacterium]